MRVRGLLLRGADGRVLWGAGGLVVVGGVEGGLVGQGPVRPSGVVGGGEGIEQGAQLVFQAGASRSCPARRPGPARPGPCAAR
jgi:hypothetical protein